jgi:hypothetical protein
LSSLPLLVDPVIFDDGLDDVLDGLTDDVLDGLTDVLDVLDRVDDKGRDEVEGACVKGGVDARCPARWASYSPRRLVNWMRVLSVVRGRGVADGSDTIG